MTIRTDHTTDMQNIPYRFAARCSPTWLQVIFSNGIRFSAIILMVILVMTLNSCQKDQAPGPPQITFIYEKGYISHDTTIEPGQKVKVGIRAVGPDANLTYFSIRLNDGKSQIFLDTGFNTPLLDYNLELIKTTAPMEKWTFLIMDRNRIEQSVQIVLTKSDIPKWRKIRSMTDIILGGQENSATGSFFSLADTLVMNLQQAFENQAMVDMVYYYGQYESTLASPNEAEAPGFFTGPKGIANWTVKNETRYDTTVITSQVFDASENDSLILSAYEPTAGKKKGKYLQPGMVFSFKSPDGKLGLIKIQDVQPASTGSVKLTIKIQE